MEQKKEYIEGILLSPFPYEINSKIVDFFKKNYDVKKDIEKATIYHIMIGEKPRRWVMALIIAKKKKNLILYSEGYDLQVVFSRYLNYQGVERPKVSKLIEDKYKNGDLFIKKQVRKIKNSINLMEIAMMRIALQKILETYVLPWILSTAFFINFILTDTVPFHKHATLTNP